MGAATGQKETHGFQTEIRQLLDLMIHSLYSNREIFLRELISNASDAADKLRFAALGDESLYEGDGDLRVRVDFDADARTVTVRDNGIGMDRAEIVENLGTIAKSGTRQFLSSLTGDGAEDARLIGQFGVGFYSCFVVADRVTVTSRRAGSAPEGGVRWESSGEGEFTVEDVEVPERGTEVVVHLRDGDDHDEFLDRYRLQAIVRKYSDHISLPIVMKKADMAADADADADGESDEAAPADETVNSATALWTRAKNEVSDEEYGAFYKHVAHDFEDPLAWVHSRVEGNVEYTSLLFVPSRAPFDLWDRNVRRGVKLYVRRVFVMDDAEQLMPPYLRFVRGIIDSADLPLNVSREILQGNRQIDAIRSASIKRVLDLIAGIAEKEPDKYAGFWGEFGKVLKEGVVEDAKNRESIAKLLRFASTHSENDDPTVSLADYVGRMKDGQERIYFITADNARTARNSPHIEIFRDKGVEVLLLTDDIDEWIVHHLTEFDDKPLQSVTKGAVDLDGVAGGEKPAADDAGGDADDEVVSGLKAALGERVQDVRTTMRLTTSPACLVADENEMGHHLERLLAAAGQEVPSSRPIMEINAQHPMIRRFADESDASRRADWASILFDQALLSEGGRLEDPAAFVRRVNEMFLADAATTPGGAGRTKKKAAKRKRAAKKKPDAASD